MAYFYSKYGNQIKVACVSLQYGRLVTSMFPQFGAPLVSNLWEQLEWTVIIFGGSVTAHQIWAHTWKFLSLQISKICPLSLLQYHEFWDEESKIGLGNLFHFFNDAWYFLKILIISGLVAEKTNSKLPHLDLFSFSRNSLLYKWPNQDFEEKNVKFFQVLCHTWWGEVWPCHVTDSSYQSFCKLKSITLTLKTGLGGVWNKLVVSLAIWIYMQLLFDSHIWNKNMTCISNKNNYFI